jgi:ACS family hexuronate transporter-like MFS transporter
VRAVVLWFPVRERATAIGINQAAINVSGMLGAATLPALAGAAGWRAGFLAMGLLGVVVTVIAAVGYRDPSDAGRRRHERRSGAPAVEGGDEAERLDAGWDGDEAEPVVANGDAVAAEHGWAVTRRLLRSRDVWLLMLFGLFLGVVEYSALTQLVLYLKDVYLLGAVAAGGMLALCQAAGAIGKPLSGLMSDRLFDGRRRAGLLILTALSLACCVVLAVFSSGLGWVLAAVVALLGLGAVGWGGLFGTLAGEIGGRAAAGQVAGFTAAGVNVGVLFGPPLFGLIVDRTGSYGAAWTMLAAASVVAAVCVALVREPRDAAVREAATLADA